MTSTLMHQRSHGGAECRVLPERRPVSRINAGRREYALPRRVICNDIRKKRPIWEIIPRRCLSGSPAGALKCAENARTRQRRIA
jgi:hypothetical protein